MYLDMYVHAPNIRYMYTEYIQTYTLRTYRLTTREKCLETKQDPKKEHDVQIFPAAMIGVA